MTSVRPPDRLDVPVERLAGGRDHARRAATVAIALAAVVGGAFGIARLTERPASSAAPRTADPSAASASAAASPSAKSATSARIERLLPVAQVALPGAPEVTLAERAGDGTDLAITVWTPDDAATRVIRRIPHVLPGGFDPVFPVVAPNRRAAAILTAGDTSYPDEGSATLVDEGGRTLWTGDRITIRSGALWSSDSRLLVVPGRPRRWRIVALDARGRATARTVELPREVYLPNPIPNGSISLPSIEPTTVPLGFSADAEWIYGGVISPELGMLIGEFRVASDGSAVEALTDFRVGRPDGLVPRPGTLGTRTVDPLTGRIATSRINADTTGGPRTVEVRAPDAAHLFDVPGGVTFGWEWGGDGALYALTGDTFLYADSLELIKIDPDGSSGPALVTTGPLTGGALIGVRDGFAVLGLIATRPDPATQLVAVDLAHPERMTALPDPGDDLLAATLDR